MSIVQQGARLPVIHPDTTQNVSVSGATARTSTAFTSGVEMIRIVSTTDCWYKVGSSSVEATTSDVFLPAGVVEILKIKGGADTHIAVIQNSASGTLNVAEVD